MKTSSSCKCKMARHESRTTKYCPVWSGQDSSETNSFRHVRKINNVPFSDVILTFFSNKRQQSGISNYFNKYREVKNTQDGSKT